MGSLDYCGLLDSYKYFEGTCRLHLHGKDVSYNVSNSDKFKSYMDTINNCSILNCTFCILPKSQSPAPAYGIKNYRPEKMGS